MRGNRNDELILDAHADMRAHHCRIWLRAMQCAIRRLMPLAVVVLSLALGIAWGQTAKPRKTDAEIKQGLDDGGYGTHSFIKSHSCNFPCRSEDPIVPRNAGIA